MRKLLPSKFEYVLYRSEDLPQPDVTDLEIEVIGPGQKTNAGQRQCLDVFHLSALNLMMFRGLISKKTCWVFLAKMSGQYCHYTFVTAAKRYAKVFPVIVEPKAILVGPCFTDESVRGRGIYPRVVQYAVNLLQQQGFGPFYIHTDTTNIASIRGMEKARFIRAGVWRGWRCLRNMVVVSHKVEA